MPKPSSLANSYTATYDAWNRMIQVKDGGTTLATYGYDGRNRRITVDTGVVRHFYFTDSWRDVEERLGSLTTADQQYVWGHRYIDELICRDRLVSGSSSSSSSSSSSGSGGLNERLYATQDANFNVTSLLDTSANVAERYTFDPYGTPTFRNASWADIGVSAKASTILYAGYKYDAETGLCCVRNRYLQTNLGNWGIRDPLEYTDLFNLYAYVSSSPTAFVDPTGLKSRTICLALYQDSAGEAAQKAQTQAERNRRNKAWDKELDQLDELIKKCCTDWGPLCDTNVFPWPHEGSISLNPPKGGYNFGRNDDLSLVEGKLRDLRKRNRTEPGPANCYVIVLTTAKIVDKNNEQMGGLTWRSEFDAGGETVSTPLGTIIQVDALGGQFPKIFGDGRVLAHELGHCAPCADKNTPRDSQGHVVGKPGHIMSPRPPLGKNIDRCYCKALERLAN